MKFHFLLISTLMAIQSISQSDAGTTAALPKVFAGTIKHFENFPSKFVTTRNVDVWLPQGYSTKSKYAVLYMHDGQMLFDSTITWNHEEWGVDETATKLMNEKKVKPFIVVGIWNGGATRHVDYFPQKPFESLTQYQQDTIYGINQGSGHPIFSGKIQSDNYLKFIVTELKPFIDSTFSTLSGRQNTFIAGSSMGGLISIYAICEYPAIFGGAACLSTHWPGIFTVENNPIPAAFFKYLQGNLPSPSNHKIYFDHGTATLDAMYPPLQKKVDAIMQAKGYTAKNWQTKEFVGADHSETSWGKRLDIPLLFLLGR